MRTGSQVNCKLKNSTHYETILFLALNYAIEQTLTDTFSGGIFGNELKPRGAVTALVSYLEDYKIQLDLDLGDTEISGHYDLTISGTVATVTGFIPLQAVAMPDIVINDIAAPCPNNLDEISDTIEQTVEGVEGVEILEITVINNSANRITFTVSVAAAILQEGVTVNVEYELEYD